VGVLVSLGRARNHICPDGHCPICQPDELPSRPYHCAVCDVYGKGLRCWSCGSAEVEWNRIPADR